jgi:transcriptional regulator with XRE-family HTH domain
MKGKELKRRRKALNLTQVELSEIFGVRSNTVARWENGVSPIPKLVPLALETVERSLSQDALKKTRAK